jgi:hypothetical protein
MRRVSLLAVLFLLLSSCMYRPVYVDPTSGMGTPRPKLAPRGGRGGVQVCREVRRVPCDKQTCGTTGRDLVTLHCPTGEVTRCEIGRGEC